MNNLIHITRNKLNMTQKDFGIWLARETGRASPFPAIQISKWERGVYSPRDAVRSACAPIVAKVVAAKFADQFSFSIEAGQKHLEKALCELLK